MRRAKCRSSVTPRRRCERASTPETRSGFKTGWLSSKAADTPDDISRLPPARCHELKQDRKGQLAVDLVHPKRLIFEPDHDPVPKKKDGGVDWKGVTRVLVIEVTDYH